MEYIRFVDISPKQWDDYVKEINGTVFDYTAERIQFNEEYSKSVICNESFVALDNKIPIAVSEIYIEEYKQETQISWNGSFCLAPYIDIELGYRKQEKYGKKIMAYIDKKAKHYKCKKIMLRESPLGNPEEKAIFYNYNHLLKYGYVDASSMTQIIDLRRTQEELYADIRKGHKSSIKRGNFYQIEIYDKETVTDEMIEIYKEIYETDAGKVTRNSELYRYYLEFIKKGMGIIAFGKKDNNEVGVAIITLYKNTAYYSSYGELENELGDNPIGHILQWEVMKYLKAHGIEFYEIGEQVFGKTHYDIPEEKLIHISNFKRGFGGYTAPFWRGIKILCD